jgi:hypothetical protein
MSNSFQIIRTQPVQDMAAFFDATPRRGKLIYASNDEKKEILKVAGDHGYMHIVPNCEDLGLINNIGRTVLLVTPGNELLLRGIDYSSNGPGLDLLIGASLASDRMHMQTLARVGRLDDEAGRFIIRGVEAVDQQMQRIAHGKLNVLIHPNANQVSQERAMVGAPKQQAHQSSQVASLVRLSPPAPRAARET